MRSNNEGDEVFLSLFVLAGQMPLDHDVQFKSSGSLLRNVDIKEMVQRRITQNTKQKGQSENFRLGKRCQNHSKGLTNNFRYVKMLT